MKIKRDEIDLERLQGIVQSSGYAMIRERIEQARGQAFRDLVSAVNWEAAARLQERIATLDMVLGLPAVIAAEIRKGQKV